MTYHPENTLTHYMTQLPQPIQLNGEWEVGLAEIQFPHSWYNVSKPLVMTIIEQERTDRPDMIHIELPPGFYTPRSMVEAWQQLLFDCGASEVGVYLDRPQKKVTLRVPPNKEVWLDKQLQTLLNFPTRQVVRTTSSSQPVDIHQGFHSIFVYTNIAEPHVVGDVRAPLLRIIPINHSLSGLTHTRSYERIYYFPLATREFSSLEIDLRTDVGEPVPFESGKVIVQLHFRQRKKSLL